MNRKKSRGWEGTRYGYFKQDKRVCSVLVTLDRFHNAQHRKIIPERKETPSLATLC